MIFTETPLAGAFVIDPEPRCDDRGFFARLFCAREFAARGLAATVAQVSLSHNRARGTIRGLHFRPPPSREAKLVRCVRGAIHDVIVDLRPGARTRGRHFAVELSAENRRALYVPTGFAHGFQALASDTEILYQMSEFHVPGEDAGLRYNDPALGIEWPLPVAAIARRDEEWPDFRP